MPAGPAVCHRMWQQLLEGVRKALVLSPESAVPPRALHVGHWVKRITAGLALGTQMTAQYLRCQRAWPPNAGKIPGRSQTVFKSCSQELQGEECPLAGDWRESPSVETSYGQTGGRLGNYRSRSEIPMDYSGVQKPSGLEEFPSKQWGAHASFLRSLSTGRTDLWEGGHEGQRACWALTCGRWEGAHGWYVEVASTC